MNNKPIFITGIFRCFKFSFVSKNLGEGQMPGFSLCRHPCYLYKYLINLPHNSDTIDSNFPRKDIIVIYNTLYGHTKIYKYKKNAGARIIKIHIKGADIK
jgi:hypothetical protein